MTFNQPTLKSLFSSAPDEIYINGFRVPQEKIKIAIAILKNYPRAIKAIAVVRISGVVKFHLSTYTAEEQVQYFSNNKLKSQCEIADFFITNVICTDRLADALRQVAEILYLVSKELADCFSKLAEVDCFSKLANAEKDNGGKQ